MTVACVSSVICRFLHRSVKPIVTENAAGDRAKSSPKITVAPLVLSRPQVGRVAETVLLFSVTLLCLMGAVALFSRQVM